MLACEIYYVEYASGHFKVPRFYGQFVPVFIFLLDGLEGKKSISARSVRIMVLIVDGNSYYVAHV